MTLAETTTSSGEPQRHWRTRLIAGTALLNGLLGTPATTAAGYPPVLFRTHTAAEFPNQLLEPQGERAGEEQARSAGTAIFEVRRLSGLTWQELADLLGVHRRTLHLWANGRPINAVNERRLQRLLGAMRRIDRGKASWNRSLLLQPQAEGVCAFDLLCDEQFGDAVALVGDGPGRQRGPTTLLAVDTVKARRPSPPGELLGALQDRVHRVENRLMRAEAGHLKARSKKD
jgi:hypothetical protein